MLVRYLCEHPASVGGKWVLDVGTGSGVIAVFAASLGAARVIALDKDPEAIRCAQANAARYGFQDMIEVRLSDMFEALQAYERFEVVTANLPFRDMPAADSAERTMWDPGLESNRRFFADVGHYLAPGGIVYLAQANFGALSEVPGLARAAGFSERFIGENDLSRDDPTDSRIFCVYGLQKRLPERPAENGQKV